MGTTRLLTLLAATLLVSPPSQAGRIADLLSDGIFGLAWGASRADIESAFPDGKWKKIGPAMVYWVNDVRSVLNIERGEKSRIGFALSSDDKLTGVTIEFVPGGLDKWTELIQKSQEAFGPFLKPDLEQTAIAGTLLLQWEDDGGVKVVAASTPGFGKGSITLNVSKVNFGPPKTKEELGLK